MGTSISSFTDDAARRRFLAAYEQAMGHWPAPRDDRQVTTRFGATRVYAYGSGGAGTPVVLLHGQLATPAEWAPHVAALAEGRPVLAVDRVGEPGLSTQSAPLRTKEAMAAWLDEVLAGLGLERAHLVGHSYGGWVALNQAAHAPARVASVTVYDPPAALAPLKARFVLGAMAATLGRSEAFRQRWFDGVIGATGAEPEFAADLNALTLQALDSFRVRLLPPPRMSDDELRSIAVPALVLLGGASPVADGRRAAERARRMIPGARVEVVPGAAHGIPVGAFNALVPGFLEEAGKG